MKNIKDMTFNEMLTERIENRNKMKTLNKKLSSKEYYSLVERNTKLRDAMNKLEKNYKKY